jgi:hypothetical protein
MFGIDVDPADIEEGLKSARDFEGKEVEDGQPTWSYQRQVCIRMPPPDPGRRACKMTHNWPHLMWRLGTKTKNPKPPCCRGENAFQLGASVG